MFSTYYISWIIKLSINDCKTMYEYTKKLIFILLLNDLSFSEWILNFSEEFDQNSSNLALWRKLNLEMGKSILNLNF